MKCVTSGPKGQNKRAQGVAWLCPGLSYDTPLGFQESSSNAGHMPSQFQEKNRKNHHHQERVRHLHTFRRRT